MWIKKPVKPLGESLSDKLNFLYKSDNIYIMDNHLAAGWSWLNSIDIEEMYNLFHIDRHYDLLDFPVTMKEEIIDRGIELHKLDLSEYLELKQPIGNSQLAPMFRWDNYIANLNIVYPNLFAIKYFATHKEGKCLDGYIDHEVEFQELIGNLDYWIESNNKNKWILNLDIDYFFANVGDGKIQIFSDQFITELAKSIKKVMDKIEVLTICLSPECCGGWDVPLEKNKIICEVLEVEFEI